MDPDLEEARRLAWYTGVRLYNRTEQCQRLYEEVTASRRCLDMIRSLLNHLDLTRLNLIKLSKEGDGDGRVIQFVVIVRYLLGLEG